VRALLAEEAKVAAAVQAVAGDVAHAAELAAAALGRGGRLVYCGAGTSGRLGVADAAECPPTFGSDPAQVIAFVAGGGDAVFRAKEGAEDNEEDARVAVEQHDVGPDDLLVGISASGRTPFVLSALRTARERGAATVLITAAAAAGTTVADCCIVLDTGPEALTGSTRLKAATATKMVLATLSTTAMVRLGKVHGNLMVDLTPTCAKLQDRARRILGAIVQVDAARADALLAAAGGSTKVAAVMAVTNKDAGDARERLALADGSLRAALAAAEGGEAAVRRRKTR
jgi:N-acetylmuramic acid 6-phosphate etherase